MILCVSGKGTLVCDNGQSYEGEWSTGKRNGFGVWVSEHGDRYEGQWDDDLRQVLPAGVEADI